MAPGKVTAAKAVAGYLLNHQQNDAFVATNRLLAAKEDVYWLKSPVTVGTTDLSGRRRLRAREADHEGGRSTRSRRSSG